jgi:hypothetical protein
MIRITHPHPKQGRHTSFQLDFRNGVAEVESLHAERELALLQHGFTVEKTLEVAADPEGPFEDLPEAVEGDATPKISRRRTKAD